MSELPQTHDLPQAREGYDPERVEEAFAAFADRVRELEGVASELRAELHSLRSERAQPRSDDEVWPADPRAAFVSPDWVSAVPSPLQRPVAVPRLALEAAFLLSAGLLAGLADLSTAWIVLVMAVAWSLVALAEWAAAAKRARWRLDEIAPPLGSAEAAETTGPWDMPVVEATVVDAGPDPESKTIVTKLPADSEPADAEPEPPKRRRSLRRRKQPAEAGAADPWEA
ncbi:MAG: hypothetical protein ACRDNB_03725 [Gaiellaceae bacterium]